MSSIRVAREASVFGAVYGVITIPRPPTKAGLLIVADGLAKLVPRIHDEGPVMGDRLADRLALEQEELGALLAGLQSYSALGLEADLMTDGDLYAFDSDGRSREKIERAVGTMAERVGCGPQLDIEGLVFF